MSGLALTIWSVTVLIVAVAVVPVAVALLRRALRAARAIESNLADMLDAGVRIAGHTGAVPALDETIATAVAMKPVARSIEERTGVVAGILSRRAQGG
ncbi:MAG: hypothetical protein ACTS3R_21375 [Inquilinaceae bacterium]